MKKSFLGIVFALMLTFTFPVFASTDFSRIPDLKIGDISPYVSQIQKLLNTNGYTVNLIPGEPGSLGFETDKFGALTKKALTAFQASFSIPATGYFGPLTKAKMDTIPQTASATSTNGKVLGVNDQGDTESLCLGTPTLLGLCWERTPVDFDWRAWYASSQTETWSDYPLARWSDLFTFRNFPNYYQSSPCISRRPHLVFLQVSSWNRVRYVCGETPTPPPSVPPTTTYTVSCKAKEITPKVVNGKTVNVEWTAIPAGNAIQNQVSYVWSGDVKSTFLGAKEYSLVYKASRASASVWSTALDSLNRPFRSTNLTDRTNACLITVPPDNLKATCTAELVNGTSSDGTKTNVRFSANTNGGTNPKYILEIRRISDNSYSDSNSDIVNVYVKPGDTAIATLSAEASFTNFDRGEYSVKSSNSNNWCKVTVPNPKITCSGLLSKNSEKVDWSVFINGVTSEYAQGRVLYKWQDGSVTGSSATTIPSDSSLESIDNQVKVSYLDEPYVTVQCEPFKVKYKLNITKVGDGKIINKPAGSSCGNNCSSYSVGTSVTLTASSTSGSYVFDQWIGSCTGKGSTCTLVMGDDKNVIAKFKQKKSYKLTIKKQMMDASSYGSVSLSVDNEDFYIFPPVRTSSGETYSIPEGEKVSLQASPQTSTFEGWSGTGCSGKDLNCTFAMTSNRTITAKFKSLPLCRGWQVGFGTGGGIIGVCR